jgi:hypothetical protein
MALQPGTVNVEPLNPGINKPVFYWVFFKGFMAVKILEEMEFETDGHFSKFLTEDIAAEADLIFRATFEEIRSLLNRNSDRIPSSLSKRKRNSRLYMLTIILLG